MLTNVKICNKPISVIEIFFKNPLYLAAQDTHTHRETHTHTCLTVTDVSQSIIYLYYVRYSLVLLYLIF